MVEARISMARWQQIPPEAQNELTPKGEWRGRFFFIPLQEFKAIRAKFKPPSVTEMVVSSVKAASDFAKSGFQMCSDGERQERLTICHQCEQFDKSGYGGKGKCKKCGCSMFKVYAKAWECPLQKWKKIL